MELDNSKLRVTSHTSLARFFDFNLVSVEVVNKGNHFVIRPTDTNREIYFEFVDKKESVTEWVDLINKIVKESEGRINKYTYLTTVPNFEKI